MRVLPVVVALLGVAAPAVAKPKPKIAVAPIQGDAGNKIASAVVDALAGKDFVVVDPREVGREVKLGASGPLGAKDVRTLIKQLDLVAVIDGKLGKPGKKRSLHLEVHRGGKASSGFTIEFRSSASESFRRGVHDQVVKLLDSEADPAGEDDDGAVAANRDDDDRKRKREREDDEATARRQRDDDDRKRDADRKRKLDDDEVARRPRRSATDDQRADRKRVADDRAGKRADDDEPAVRKRKPARRARDTAPSLARVAAGASVAQRQLSYDTRSGFTQVPPRVATTAGGGRVDGEIYPFALADPDSSLAALGVAASYDQTFGLAIKIPNQPVSAPISQSHYAIGARYRIGVGEASTVTLGVDYTAIAPGVAVRVPVAPSLAVFGGADGLLLLDAGPIQDAASYGPAKVYGLEALAGVDLQVARQLGLRIAIEYSQINFAFNARGTMSTSRDNDPATQDVTGAVDRSIGVAATLGLVY